MSSPPHQPGPHPETLDLGQRCLDLLAQGLERHLLAERLHVTRKRVDHALRTVRKVQAEADAAAAGEPPPEKPRRPHRAVHQRPSDGPQRDWTWQERAACKGQPLELFFGREGERGEDREPRERRAKDFCGICPVQAECLDYSMGRPEKHGTWGALNEAERAGERRRRMKTASNHRIRERAQQERELREEEAVA